VHRVHDICIMWLNYSTSVQFKSDVLLVLCCTVYAILLFVI
jgi:hypothetical protein